MICWGEAKFYMYLSFPTYRGAETYGHNLNVNYILVIISTERIHPMLI